jgi:hypothetical protein
MAEAPAPDTTTAASAAEQASFIELFPGTALTSADADAVTLRARTHLIVLAGAEDSGKTTVLASIYEHLNRGPFAGFYFSGSRSLLGFEEICHLNRLESGGVRPDTQRTVPTEDTMYYHLALKGADREAKRRDVLLSAMSGELFRMAKDSREDTERLTYLRRADTIAVLVDGARLTIPAQRTNAQADAANILDSFLDANMVSTNCKVEVVFSKADRVHAAGQVAVDFLGKTQEKLEAKFRSRVPSLSFKKIAARPDPSSSSDEWDAGLAAAFLAWTTPYHPAPRDDWKLSAPPVDEREFSKFGWRYFEQFRRLS